MPRKVERRDLERVPADHDPIYTVYLDAGSFSWLYEMLQAKTRTTTWIESYQALVRRTLRSFEEAKQGVEADPAPRKRVIPRQTTKRR